jgi:hypothetical protein
VIVKMNIKDEGEGSGNGTHKERLNLYQYSSAARAKDLQSYKMIIRSREERR